MIAKLQSENRKLAKKDKEQKLARLEEIAWGVNAKPSDVIAAIRVHNEMTGDNQPSKVVVESRYNLDDIRERAKRITSVLCRIPNNFNSVQP